MNEKQDRHRLYLQGFLSAAAQEAYETEVADDQATAEALHVVYHNGESWDPEMLARARAMLAVLAATREVIPPNAGIRSTSLRPIDLLPAERHDHQGGDRVAGAALLTAVARVVNHLISHCLQHQADGIEIIAEPQRILVVCLDHDSRREMMNLPAYMWDALAGRIRRMAALPEDGDGEPEVGLISLWHQGTPYSMTVSIGGDDDPGRILLSVIGPDDR